RQLQNGRGTTSCDARNNACHAGTRRGSLSHALRAFLPLGKVIQSPMTDIRKYPSSSTLTDILCHAWADQTISSFLPRLTNET
ncbi:hypothetical protein, partial [Acetobacter lambici]